MRFFQLRNQKDKCIIIIKNENHSQNMKRKDQILELLKNSSGHMRAEEMYMYCKDNDIKISLATTYRTLGKLAEEGQIRKISVPGWPDVFDKTLVEHEHMICSVCGKVKDIKVKNLKKMILNEVNEEIDSYELCIKYTCSDCKKKKKLY